MADTKVQTTKNSKLKTKNSSVYVPRLKALYNDKIRAELAKELDLNVNEVPRLLKISVNVGLGKSKEDKKMFEVAENTLIKITGQKPVPTYSRMSIATFKLREGNKIGMRTTLRGDKMYEFADRLINIIMPRLRDFHGVSNKSFDEQGNYSIGFRDQSVFPELSFEETANAHGLQINFTIQANNKEQARAFLEKMGMPFMKEGK